MDEASTNVIEHAYRGASDRFVELRFRAGEATSCAVEIVDDGSPVDTRALPEVDLRRYASEGRRGGLGVHLMGRIMDTVTLPTHRARQRLLPGEAARGGRAREAR